MEMCPTLIIASYLYPAIIIVSEFSVRMYNKQQMPWMESLSLQIPAASSLGQTVGTPVSTLSRSLAAAAQKQTKQQINILVI